MAFICLFFIISAPFKLAAHDLIAVTESGKAFVIAEVEKEVENLMLTLRNSGITMADPVVDITGLAELTKLAELTFYHVPQIASFEFLAECASVERLIISFARVRSVRFLQAMPNLEMLHLEICDDWESDTGLPFLIEPFDLSANSKLEYLAFRICDLKRVPVITSIPETLRVFDISYNAIAIDASDVPALSALRQVERIFINGNTVGESILASYNNLILENSDALLSRYLGE